MMSDTPSTLFELIKRLGVQAEAEINQFIKKELDDKDIIHLLNKELLQHAELRRLFQRLQKLLLSQLHLPNKDDVANLSKLIIQLEEKIDNLEERIANAEEEPTLKEYKPIESAIESVPSTPSLPTQLEEINKKKLEKLQLIMQLPDMIGKFKNE
ncbi:hypothetical protein [Bacillus sp. FJAT-45350]|uniref:hypothetical protein n=1 Tax=Bacillus sp. FJAT-45350 TaxID=2011014 RepID=UPI001154FE4C|nr:hypothetical protein [Bacillus sp. FJAT-45350]